MNMHNLLCDALQGYWWHDDEQIVRFEAIEYFNQPWNGVLLIAWPVEDLS